MMISQTAEYALRAAVCLAAATDGRLTTPQIAEQTCVPAGYLSKVLQSLGRAGIVQSQRGLGGGFRLARDPAQVTILEVINAVDPVQRIASCPLHLAAHQAQLCPLHQRLDDALAAVEEAFQNTVLSELLDPNAPSRPLCDVPLAALLEREAAAKS